MDDVLIYDIETATQGKPDATKDVFKVFGCYSYKTNKYYLTTSLEEVQKLIDSHKFLVGFNNAGTKYNPGYDNPILVRHGISFKYKTMIDLRSIFLQRASQMKIKKGMLGDLIMEYSLDYITRLLELVDDSTAKEEIDYDIFKKDTWSKEEMKEIKKYTLRDIEVTKKLYQWTEDYFAGFKDFINEKDVEKKQYLTSSLPGLAYKAICKQMRWEEKHDEVYEDDKIGGGYVGYPAGEQFEGDIYCLDFNCFPQGTKIRMCTKNGTDGHYYDKNIENVKLGDKVLNQDGMQIVGGIEKQHYNGELISIELENGSEVKCTLDHKFPIYRDGKEMVVEAKDLLESDDMISTKTKRGKSNPGFKQGQIQKICTVCGTEFDVFPSLKHINTCSSECANVLRSLNNAKTNLGKTKYDTPHLMKMSIERTGKNRTEEHKNNISVGTTKGMKNIDMRTINKKRDMSFMKTIDWKLKIAQSRMKNVKEGKYRYKEINFRSNWEVILAKNLDKNNIKWKYEYKVFKLDDETYYLPDFYLVDYDKWVEVKGYMYDHSRKKIQKFMENNELTLLTDIKTISDTEVKWLKSEV